MVFWKGLSEGWNIPPGLLPDDAFRIVLSQRAADVLKGAPQLTEASSGASVFLLAAISAAARGERKNVQVLVRDNNVDQALRALKKKMQREGIFREMKLRRNYEKPSEKRAREKAEAVRRTRKLLRKRLEREGY